MPRSDAVRNIDRILESAMHVLAVNPGATLRDIADASAVHRATLHRHFTSRDELMRVLYARAADEAEAAYWAAGPDQGPFDEALARVLDAAVVLSDRYRVLLLADDPEFAPYRAKITRPLQALFRHGRATGALRTDLPVRWALLVFRGVLVAASDAITDGAMTREQATRAAKRTLLEGLGQSGGAPGG
jgi:AcrR family transcriptional regulator